MTTDTDTAAAAAARIRAARDAADIAQAAFEQIVRDEIAADRITVTETVHALGVKNRQRIYDILNREPGEPTAPGLTRVVYLRARGCGARTWTAVEQAMWARGWATTRHRGTAWHLARGGATVVLCDFSAHFDGLETDQVLVGRVRARYRDDGDTDLPLDAGGHRLMPIRHDPDVLTKGGTRGAWVLDEDALARIVGVAFDEQWRED
ncbi:hypothetical protein [Nocardia farcinica]|uniref:hypothetical protein n=1 Tax=Nocardia farcinica TaxID=37329 RepID=UPI00245408C0|nr:hypothetical protein [Nocardia farcinica]